MITIPIRVCGDYWVNPDEVKEKLEHIAGQTAVVLDLQAEGPSLGRLGVIDLIDEYCNKYQVDSKNIYIQHWSNTAEPVEYSLLSNNQHSHFFSDSLQYWKESLEPETHEYVFGFFIGRRSIPRAIIMHDLYCAYGSQNLLSALKNKSDTPWNNSESGINLDKLDQWLPAEQQQKFINWWDTDPIPSVDNHSLDDQYQPNSNTNRDLIEHYHRFDIELVAESYTCGPSFFPTEKTVRPIMAAKPFLIFGPGRFLERLHTLGFKTYHSVWDESYDKLEGPARWQAMRFVIDGIMTLSLEDRLSIFSQAQEISQYNRSHLISLVKNDNKDI